MKGGGERVATHPVDDITEIVTEFKALGRRWRGGTGAFGEGEIVRFGSSRFGHREAVVRPMALQLTCKTMQ